MESVHPPDQTALSAAMDALLVRAVQKHMAQLRQLVFDRSTLE